eukprot:5973437-Pyramimonas_sp.AAC.1
MEFAGGGEVNKDDFVASMQSFFVQMDQQDNPLRLAPIPEIVNRDGPRGCARPPVTTPRLALLYVGNANAPSEVRSDAFDRDLSTALVAARSPPRFPRGWVSNGFVTFGHTGCPR